MDCQELFIKNLEKFTVEEIKHDINDIELMLYKLTEIESSIPENDLNERILITKIKKAYDGTLYKDFERIVNKYWDVLYLQHKAVLVSSGKIIFPNNWNDKYNLKYVMLNHNIYKFYYALLKAFEYRCDFELHKL